MSRTCVGEISSYSAQPTFTLPDRSGMEFAVDEINAAGDGLQMLSIARTLIGNPRLILLNEPTGGLAPLIVEQTAAILALRAEA